MFGGYAASNRENGGVVLPQNLSQNRENRIRLNLLQREQTGNFLRESQSDDTLDIERQCWMTFLLRRDFFLKETSYLNKTAVAGTPKKPTR